MPGKIFQTQLENLFSKTNSPETKVDTSENSVFPGWLWECDQDGKFTYCSPEVEQALGISAKEFLSQSLLTFRLVPETTNIVEQLFHNLDEPTTARVSYYHQSGIVLPVNLTTLGQWTDLNGNTMVRGFAQLQIVEAAPSTTDELDGYEKSSESVKADLDEKTPKATNQVDDEVWSIKIASQLILQMLKHIQSITPEIQSAKDSRVISNTEQKTEMDTSSEEQEIQFLFGKRVIVHPSMRVTRLIYRLEWGKKLDLSEHEKEFLENNRFINGGLFEKFRGQFVSKTIQKTDKCWFGIVIEKIGEEKPIVKLEADFDMVQPDSLTLAEFIADPLILMPGLRLAKDHPYKENQVLTMGKDYLVSI